MATAMAFSTTLFVLLFASSAVATVEEVCKTAAQSPNVKFDFCVSSLKAAPGSATADNQGLAVITGTLTVKQATNVKSKVDLLLKGATDPKIKKSLTACQEAFSNAINDAKQGTAATKSRQLSDANVKFSAVLDAPSTCNEGFQQFHLQNPVTQDGANLVQFAAIALSIISNLH